MMCSLLCALCKEGGRWSNRGQVDNSSPCAVNTHKSTKCVFIHSWTPHRQFTPVSETSDKACGFRKLLTLKKNKYICELFLKIHIFSGEWTLGWMPQTGRWLDPKGLTMVIWKLNKSKLTNMNFFHILSGIEELDIIVHNPLVGSQGSQRVLRGRLMHCWF